MRDSGGAGQRVDVTVTVVVGVEVLVVVVVMVVMVERRVVEVESSVMRTVEGAMMEVVEESVAVVVRVVVSVAVTSFVACAVMVDVTVTASLGTTTWLPKLVCVLECVPVMVVVAITCVIVCPALGPPMTEEQPSLMRSSLEYWRQSGTRRRWFRRCFAGTLVRGPRVGVKKMVDVDVLNIISPETWVNKSL